MDLEQFNIIWPRVGGILAPIITIITLALWKDQTPTNQLALLFWLNLAVLMFHEFEEYVLPGGFKHFINTRTVLSLPDPKEGSPVDDWLIVGINLGIWILFIIGALTVEILPWLGLGMILFNFINIFGHLLIFQKKHKGYNPGTITAVLMIPFLIFAMKFTIDQQLLGQTDYIIAITIGILSGVSLPLIGSILRKKAIKKLAQVSENQA